MLADRDRTLRADRLFGDGPQTSSPGISRGWLRHQLLPQRRAAFSAAPLWVTAYDPRELYAAGLYPNQSRGGDGLPAYAARHRPVANADIVLWVTMGFHHLPRPEDWPVLPTMWHSVALVPYGFFDRNPSAQAPSDGAPPNADK